MVKDKGKPKDQRTKVSTKGSQPWIRKALKNPGANIAYENLQNH